MPTIIFVSVNIQKSIISQMNEYFSLVNRFYTYCIACDHHFYLFVVRHFCPVVDFYHSLFLVNHCVFHNLWNVYGASFYHLGRRRDPFSSTKKKYPNSLLLIRTRKIITFLKLTLTFRSCLSLSLDELLRRRSYRLSCDLYLSLFRELL